jgi:hypothetical protein
VKVKSGSIRDQGVIEEGRRGGVGMATREELLSEVGELAAHNEATYLG